MVQSREHEIKTSNEENRSEWVTLIVQELLFSFLSFFWEGENKSNFFPVPDGYKSNGTECLIKIGKRISVQSYRSKPVDTKGRRRCTKYKYKSKRIIETRKSVNPNTQES
jgi:hypothetical protein